MSHQKSIVHHLFHFIVRVLEKLFLTKIVQLAKFIEKYVKFVIFAHTKYLYHASKVSCASFFSFSIEKLLRNKCCNMSEN